jgi:hypothetical protein
MMVESVYRLMADLSNIGHDQVLLRSSTSLIKHSYRTYQFFEIKY